MSDLSQRLAAFSPERLRLLRELLAERNLELPPGPAPPSGSDGRRFPLSFGQQRIWYQHHSDPDGSLYSIVRLLRLRGPLKRAALAGAVSTVERRHEILRTRFELERGEPVQVVEAPRAVDAALPLVDLGALPGSAAEGEGRRIAEAERARRFDLERGPLFLAYLLHLSAEEHLLAVSMHHIISDAWSSEALFGEIGGFYGALGRGEWPSPAAPAMQYREFAGWQRERLQGDRREELLAFWRDQLRGASASIPLPADWTRVGPPSQMGGGVSRDLPEGLARKLHGLGREEGCTLFMVLLAAFEALLFLYTGAEDFQVGTPASHRSQLGQELLLGFCINTLALRTRLHGDLTFRDLLRRVRETALAAYSHQDLPFDLLVEALRPARKPGESVLFNVFFVFYSLRRTRATLPGLSVEFVEVDGRTAQFDLELRVWEDAGRLAASLLYATDLFAAGTAAQMIEDYERLLERAAAEPERPLLDLEPRGGLATAVSPLLLDRALKEQRDAWLARLGTDLPASGLPLDRPRPARRSGTRISLATPLGPRTPAGRAALAGSPLSICAALLAAIAACLCRYREWGAGERVLVGTPGCARQDCPERPPNAVAIPVEVNETASFERLRQAVRDSLLQAYARQDYPIAALVRDLGLAGVRDRFPLFDIALRLVGLHTPMPDLGHDLTMHCTPGPEGLSAVIEFDPRLFETATLARFAGHLANLLEGGLLAGDGPLAALAILGDPEIQQLLREWNDTASFEEPVPVQRSVFAQAERTPAAIALADGDLRLSYRDLVSGAERLAARLCGEGVGPEVPVGILAHRSAAALVGILGILAAGGVCVPLDPTYPAERLRFILREAHLSCVLVGSGCEGILEGQGSRIFHLAETAPPPAQWEPAPVRPENLAYILFTSGSTGFPKGVAMSHRGLSNLVAWQQGNSRAGAGSRTAQFASLGFDVSFQEIFATWCTGGTLCVVPDPLRGSPRDLRSYLEAAAIERLFLPCIALQQLAAVTAGRDLTYRPGARLALREVIVAGEPLRITESVERLFESLEESSLANQYGPTETHVASAWRLSGEPSLWARMPPIGRPLGNLRMYVASPRGELQPVGVAGELYLGGAGVARAYIARPELTAERFVPDPWSGEPGARLYRTGDLARWRSCGVAEFLGRSDQQVKIGGQRVEPGEIELILDRHPGVGKSAVTVWEGAESIDRRLIAYVVPAGDPAPTPAELLQFLRQALPARLVPSRVVLIESFPKTASGKLDLRALPPPPQNGNGEGEPLRTATERVVAEVWSRLLGRSPIGADDDFFALGGHSLLAARVAFELEEQLGRELALPVLFANPTVAAMARAIDSQAQGDTSAETLDLWAEAELDPRVRPRAPRVVSGPPSRILLTGGTGFLGSFLIRELLAATAAEILCLVRAEDDPAAGRRLERGLRRYGVLGDGPLPARVVPLAGDLSLPRFGLSEERFRRLGEEVEAVLHNGAAVNVTYPYSALRAANVAGSVEVLRLACLGKTKTVHFVSTAGVLQAASAAGTVDRAVRSDDPLLNVRGLVSGYGQSKWVAERLMLEAWRRGLPVSLVRPGRIAGDSATGACQEGDFFWLMVKACVQAGCAPDLKASVELLPVDLVSREVVAVAFREDSSGKAFHLRNCRALTLDELVSWMRGFGYPLATVSAGQWKRALKNLSLPPDENAAYPLLPFLGQPAVSGQPDAGATEPTEATDRGAGWQAGGELLLPELSSERLLEAHFSYFIRTGFLPRPPRAGAAEPAAVSRTGIA